MPDQEEQNSNQEELQDTQEEQSLEQDSSQEEQPSPQEEPFNGLDLNEMYCFGWEPSAKEKCWYNLSVKSRTIGWKKINVKTLEKSFSQNVNACYFYLASFYLTDVNTDIKYFCFFDNSKSLWDVQIQDSPKAEIEMEEKQAFFSSELMKKIMLRTRVLVTRAKKEYEDNLEYHLDNGELLDVDEVKLEAILHTIQQQFSMDNLSSGKFSM